MTIVPPAPDEPRRPDGPRDPGDAWVVAPDGTKYWGRFGAAGLLAVDDERGVLLQQRVSWSHHGGTWGIPGGALHEGEPAIDGAIREAQEEAGIPDGAVRPLATTTLELGYWRYTTVIGVVTEPFEPRITDPESTALAWVEPDAVTDRPLHPGFAASWPALWIAAQIRPVIVIDAANVVGSVPDGWWKDRAGATQRLLARVARLQAAGLPACALGLPAEHWFPRFTVVVEGQAKAAAPVGGVKLIAAPAEGDDAIVATTAAELEAGGRVWVVTGDRELRHRVEQLGASVHGARWLYDLLGDASEE